MGAHTSGEAIGGRYALGELLGVGGTGSVFAAVDVTADANAGAAVGERVAVKLLHPHLCDDESSRDAFLREAAHVMALRHPNVVRVHGAGLHDAAGVTMPWIALDLLRGPTLREWVDATGPLTPDDAAVLAIGLLDGLAAAHAGGIVHRDVSPQNVILHGASEVPADSPFTPDMVRLVDFGLADLSGRTTLGDDVLLTEPQAALSGRAPLSGVVGNAAYMSPEQAQGLPMRASSDLYQAGAVLYFALTGRVPFVRHSTEATLHAHLSAPPPVPSVIAPAARAFDRVVTRAMAKNPGQRFRDAAEFRDAVRRAVLPALPVTEADVSAADPATRVLPSAAPDRSLAYLGSTDDAPAPAPSPRGGNGAAAVVAGMVILGLAGWAVAAAAAPSGSSAEPPASASASPTASTAAPVPTETAVLPPEAPRVEPTEIVRVETPAEVAVPILHGSLAEVEGALQAAGLALGAVTRVESAESVDRMLSQSPAPGERLPVGGAVNVTVASGSNVVPQVAGMTLATATATLQSAGFVAASDRSGAPASSLVTGSMPGAGTVLRVGVTVTVAVETPSTPTPTSTQTATPGAP